MKPRNRISVTGLAGLFLLFSLLTTTKGEKIPSAADPAPIKEAYWIKQFGSQQKKLQSNLDVCLVGDSLTQLWETDGRPILDLQFRDLRYTNLGISADRTENILYRIKNLNFDSAKPDVFVLLAGTNNLAKTPPDSPEDTARGIRAIIDSMKEKSPTSTIILISILPNGNDPDSELRKSIEETNQIISQFADSRVVYLDLHDEFLKDDGRWKSNLTIDNTHLSTYGYDKMGIQLRQAILPVVETNRN